MAVDVLTEIEIERPYAQVAQSYPSAFEFAVFRERMHDVARRISTCPAKVTVLAWPSYDDREGEGDV